MVNEPCHEKTVFAYGETNVQISCAIGPTDQCLCFSLPRARIPLVSKLERFSLQPSVAAEVDLCFT